MNKSSAFIKNIAILIFSLFVFYSPVLIARIFFAHRADTFFEIFNLLLVAFSMLSIAIYTWQSSFLNIKPMLRAISSAFLVLCFIVGAVWITEHLSRKLDNEELTQFPNHEPENIPGIKGQDF